MSNGQSFGAMLLYEYISSRGELIELYAKRDRLLYVDAPELREKYLSRFGKTESAVLEAEIDAALLRRKLELIQRAINRREEIDLAAIDEAIRAEREQWLREAESGDVSLERLPVLDKAQSELLRKLYSEIKNYFDHLLNSEVNDSSRELYRKTREAYRMRNVEEMELLYDSLFDSNGFFTQYLAGGADADAAGAADEGNIGRVRAIFESILALASDYTLAERVYPLFRESGADKRIRELNARNSAKRSELVAEVARIEAGFPFNAAEMLSDPAKAEAYAAELNLRANAAAAEKAELEARIGRLTGK